MQQFLAILWNYGLSLKEIGVASMVLFAVIDIIGATPIVISLKEKVGKEIPQ